MGSDLMTQVRQLQEENERLRAECRRNRKQELVEHLLKGEFFTGRQIAADLQEVGVYLTKSSFVELYVRVLVHPPTPERSPDGHLHPPDHFREIFEEGIWDEIQQAFPEYFCTAIRLGTGVTAILQMEQMGQPDMPLDSDAPPGGNFVEELNHRAMELMERLQRRSHLETFVAISRPHFGIEGIPDAHREIQEIDNYRITMGIDVPLLCYHDFEMAEQERRTDFTILSLEHRYLSNVEMGDYEAARETLHTLIDEEFHRATPSLYTLRSELSAKLDLLLLTLERFQIKEPVYREAAAVQQELEHGASTVEELLAQIDRIFDCIADLEARRQTPKWMSAVLRYVDENYMDAELNVASISNVFGLSPSYLTREVKRCTGNGLLDILQKKWLDAALALLGGGAGMAQAAEKSGFGDTRSLHRAIKRYQIQEGGDAWSVSPGTEARGR